MKKFLVLLLLGLSFFASAQEEGLQQRQQAIFHIDSYLSGRMTANIQKGFSSERSKKDIMSDLEGYLKLLSLAPPTRETDNESFSSEVIFWRNKSTLSFDNFIKEILKRKEILEKGISHAKVQIELKNREMDAETRRHHKKMKKLESERYDLKNILK